MWTALKVDADKAEREITPETTNGFRPGMAVTTWDRRNGWLRCSRPYTVTGIRDGVLCLDDHLEADRIAEDGGRVIHYFPLILVEESDHAIVDGFVADAAVKDPGTVLEGLRAGVVYLWRSRHVTVRNVKAVNGRGDGIIVSNASEHAVIEDCEAAHNTHFGIHPGARRVKMVGNTTKGHPGRPVLDESGADDHQLQTLRLE